MYLHQIPPNIQKPGCIYIAFQRNLVKENNYMGESLVQVPDSNSYTEPSRRQILYPILEKKKIYALVQCRQDLLQQKKNFLWVRFIQITEEEKKDLKPKASCQIKCTFQIILKEACFEIGSKTFGPSERKREEKQGYGVKLSR